MMWSEIVIVDQPCSSPAWARGTRSSGGENVPLKQNSIVSGLRVGGAVDADVGAVDVGRVVTAEERHRGGHPGGVAHPHRRHDPVQELRVGALGEVELVGD